MKTTSSVDYVDQPIATATLARRTWQQSEVQTESGAVTHWPLWFEDPFEDKGNDTTNPNDLDPIDNKFAWNWEDYLHIAYGPGRFMLNTVAWPVSAVVTPPGTLMVSDGRLSKQALGYDHDATRADALEVEPPFVASISKDAAVDEEAPSSERYDNTPTGSSTSTPNEHKNPTPPGSAGGSEEPLG